MADGTLLAELRELLAGADEALFAVAYIRTSTLRLLHCSFDALPPGESGRPSGMLTAQG